MLECVRACTQTLRACLSVHAHAPVCELLFIGFKSHMKVSLHWDDFLLLLIIGTSVAVAVFFSLSVELWRCAYISVS